jgi:GR25 family glycosyltransferase involved in LPS biosynthesis
MENLPENFCFKVEVPEDLGPAPAVEFQAPELDAISRAYCEKYNIVNAIVIVADKISTAEYARECVRIHGLTGPSRPVVAFTLPSSKLSAKEWSERFCAAGPPLDDYVILEHVDPNDMLAILSNSDCHVLTGNLTGWYGAVMSGSKNVIYPEPWGLSPAPAPAIREDEWTKVHCSWGHSKYFDQAYYINLKRRPDRRKHMEDQLKRFNFTASRVEAFDGKTITWKPSYGVIGDYWNHGALAYCLSYRTAIIDAMKKGHDNILIMDDDCVLEDNLWEILDKAWTDLPEEWHMLYLGANHGKSEETIPTEAQRLGDYLYRLKGSVGSHAIIINKIAFDTILNYLSAPYGPLDTFYSMYHKFFPCYITYPGLASQLAGTSDIINKKVDYAKDWGVDYINHVPSRESVPVPRTVLEIMGKNPG